MVIRIKNLRLQTIIGVHDWERERQQDVVINARIEFDGSAAAASDDLADSVDYKAIERRITEEIVHSRYNLLERLAARVIEIIMEQPRVQACEVEVDKPHALSSADSVSVTHSARRPQS